MLLFISLCSCLTLELHEQRSFLGWMKETNNVFVGEEYHFRLGIWLANKKYVEQHNRANAGYTVKLNHLSHLTPTEYKSLLGITNLNSFKKEQRESSKTFVPKFKQSKIEVDYRDLGVVNPIRDQKQCGSCWAFSVVSASESNYALLYGNLPQLSEQNIIDCATNCFGCYGGLTTSALNYILDNQNGFISKLQEYPYLGYKSSCNYDRTKAVPTISNYIVVPSYSEQKLAQHVNSYGVASVILDCSRTSFQLYSSGIYQDASCSQDNLDHAMNCVGYSYDYWIIRNSWGTSWGEAGYMRLIRDMNNMCGVSTMAIVPLPF